MTSNLLIRIAVALSNGRDRVNVFFEEFEGAIKQGMSYILCTLFVDQTEKNHLCHEAMVHHS